MDPLALTVIDRIFRRFSAYAVVGSATFILDMGIVAMLVYGWNTHQATAIILGFVTGLTINYTMCREWVYRGTRREIVAGLALFSVAAVAGALFIVSAVDWLVATFDLPLLIARTAVGAGVGVANFCFNTFVNFKVL